MKMSGLIDLINNLYPDIQEIKRYLDDHPEEIHVLDRYYRSPLYIAATNNIEIERTDIVELLLEHGSNIEQDILFSGCCIMHSLHMFSLEIARILINSCKNINILDMNKYTPIMQILDHEGEFCSRQNIIDICKYMLDTRTDLDLSIKSFYFNKTAYDIAREHNYHELAELIKNYKQDTSLETKGALD